MRTDHSALQWIQQFKQPEGQVARWLEQLQQFDFETEHRAGSQHNNADALSRIHHREADHLYSVSQTSIDAPDHTAACWAPAWTQEELREQQRADSTLGLLISWMEQAGERPPEATVAGTDRRMRSLWAQWNQVELVDGLLYRRWRETTTGSPRRQLIIPRPLVPDVLEALHNGPGGGHLGLHKSLAKIRDRFYWPHLREDVEDWCRRCTDCAQSKTPSPVARGPLQPSQVGYPMERLALDIFGPLPTSKQGNRYILVVSDYFTRWVEAYG